MSNINYEIVNLLLLMTPRSDPLYSLFAAATTVAKEAVPLAMGIHLEVPSPASLVPSHLQQTIAILDPMSLVTKRLAYQLVAEGKYDEAEPYLRILLECRSNVFGGDADTAPAYQMLGYVLDKQGKYEEALRHYKCSLKSYEQGYGRGHPDADLVYSCITQLCRKTKQFDEALQKSTSLLEIRLETLGDAHPKAALSCHDVAICLYDLGRHEEALDMLVRALTVQQNAGDGDVHGICGIYTTMAKILVEQKKFDKALQIYDCMLTRQVPVLGQCSRSVALTLRDIGLVYESQGDNAAALNACVKAVEIQIKLIRDRNCNAAWRPPCQKNTGSIDALNAEASMTLQIVQSLEKKVAITICPPQLKTNAGSKLHS
ncbi:MAG: hypothetical protein SGBAC_010635 [Bacillariaceae sp.]